MKLIRKATFFASLCGLATIAIVGPVEGSASAATSATIGYDNLTGMFGGSGFTPGGLVLVQEQEGASVIGSVTVRATSPKTHCYYIPSEGWECYRPGSVIMKDPCSPA